MTRALCFAAGGLFLSGCGVLGPPVLDAYVPVVSDAGALERDKGECRKYALAYREPFSLGRVGTAAVRGAGQNAAEAPINPVIPLAGAVGSAGVATLDSLGILSDKQKRVFLRCLTNRGNKSGAYEVMDPNL